MEVITFLSFCTFWVFPGVVSFFICFIFYVPITIFLYTFIFIQPDLLNIIKFCTPSDLDFSF